MAMLDTIKKGSRKLVNKSPLLISSKLIEWRLLIGKIYHSHKKIDIIKRLLINKLDNKFLRMRDNRE